MADHKKGVYGAGSIAPAGQDRWRIRYRIDGRRFSTTVKGTKATAVKEMRRLLTSGDSGSHIAPNRMAVALWIDEWLVLKSRSLKTLSVERYDFLLKGHVVPHLGRTPLQRVTPADIDRLYGKLDLSAGTMTLLHTTLKSCLAAAVKKKLIASNPCADAEKPAGEVRTNEIILDADELGRLVEAFKGNTLFAIVATAAATGMRRNEILALRWDDIDFATGMVTVRRNVENSKTHGRRAGTPKSARSSRTFQIDASAVAMLKREKELQQRLFAGIPDGAEVDMTLVKLPPGALCFPAADGIDLTALRNPTSVSNLFGQHAEKVGFPGLTLHDIRASHGTVLLDNGVAVHTVAERLGHDPATLLRYYARRTKRSDTNAAAIIGSILGNTLSAAGTLLRTLPGGSIERRESTGTNGAFGPEDLAKLTETEMVELQRLLQKMSGSGDTPGVIGTKLAKTGGCLGNESRANY